MNLKVTIVDSAELALLDGKLDGVHAKLDAILRREHRIEIREGEIMATLDDLVTKEAAEGDAIAKVLDYLTTIKAELDAAGGDPAKLQALSDSIDSHIGTLNAALPTP